MIEIDGSSGGGQMLRTALTLSAITGDNFRMENIRGNRSNPGLKRQHMECVKAAGRLCDAKTSGLKIESDTLEFKPGALRNESFTVNIGTAGSITLLLDTVLPIATQFSESFRINVKGGTDVKWSPAYESFQAKLDLLNHFGLKAESELERTGFYPAGNGEVQLEVEPSSMQDIKLMDRGNLRRFEIHSKASKSLKRQQVAERQADELERKLKNAHISTETFKETKYEDTDSDGSALVLKAVYENSIAAFDMLGEKGLRSEDVAKQVYEDFRSFHSTEAAVDEHLADQMIVFLAIIGGEVAIPEITSHVQTSLEVVGKFGREVEYIDGETSVIKR